MMDSDVLCISCADSVSGRRHALQCDGCERWQHRLCGTGVDIKTYRQMTKQQRDGGPQLTWHCSNCTNQLTIPQPAVEDEDVDSLVDMERREADMDVTDTFDDATAESTRIDRSSVGEYGTFVVEPPSNSDVSEPLLNQTYHVTIYQAPEDSDQEETSTMHTASSSRSALDDTFDVTRRVVEDDEEIAEESIRDESVLDSILEDRPVTFTVVESGTQRNKVKLVSSDGYEYTRKKANSKTGFTLWRCIKRSKTMNCTASVSQKGNTFQKNSREHIHQADKGAKKKVIVQKEVKSIAKGNINRPARQIVDDVILEIIEPQDHQLPKLNNLKRLANRVRANMRPTEPTSLEFELDQSFLQCDDFLVGDVRVDDQRHLIFATPTQLDILNKAKRWFCDGTFKVVSRPFTQLWSIHAFIRKGDSVKQVPLVFSLMSRRKTKDYRAVLEAVNEKLDHPEVEGFVMDFEKGAWKAVREVFPNTIIKGCAFHFSQAVWRKTQELGLATTYTERGAEYKYIRSMLALPFLPHTDTERAFEQLEQRANSIELQQLTRYMRSTWIENPVWNPRTWSIYQRRVRTNNDVEGWHTRLIANAGRANLTFYILVPLLRREADLVDITFRLVTEEQILRDHRNKYSKLQGRLQEVWERYGNDDLSASQLLKECSKFYGPAND